MKSIRVCSVDGCEKNAAERGWCSMHYSRWIRHGDVDYQSRAPNGTGCVSSNGYRSICIDGKSRLEHDLVMESALGRALLPDEEVHHRNRDRLDNRIENLVLTTHSEHKRLHASFRNGESKECTRCHHVKSRDEFTPVHGKKGRDPHSPWCRPCAAQWQRERYARALGRPVRTHTQFQSGEQHPNARLSRADVVDIKRRIQAGERQTAVARRYGVSKNTIHGIHKGRTWREVAV